MTGDVCERKRARDRAYYYAHREEKLAYRRRYYEKNKERYRSYKSNPVSVGTVKSVRAMEECLRMLSGSMCHIKDCDAAAVMRRCIDDIAEVCMKLKNK